MNLIRKYKISKLLNKPLEGKDNEIIMFIQEWLKDLKLFRYNENFCYMKSDGKFVFGYDDDDFLWVRYNGFWRVLENHYSINYNDIQFILKYMIENLLKEKVGNPDRTIGDEVKTIERAYKEDITVVENDYKKINRIK